MRGSALSALRPETPPRSASAVGRGVNDALRSQGVPGPTRAPLFSATEFTDALPVCGTPWWTHSQRSGVRGAAPGCGRREGPWGGRRAGRRGHSAEPRTPPTPVVVLSHRQSVQLQAESVCGGAGRRPRRGRQTPCGPPRASGARGAIVAPRPILSVRQARGGGHSSAQRRKWFLGPRVRVRFQLEHPVWRPRTPRVTLRFPRLAARHGHPLHRHHAARAPQAAAPCPLLRGHRHPHRHLWRDR